MIIIVLVEVFLAHRAMAYFLAPTGSYNSSSDNSSSDISARLPYASAKVDAGEIKGRRLTQGSLTIENIWLSDRSLGAQDVNYIFTVSASGREIPDSNSDGIRLLLVFPPEFG